LGRDAAIDGSGVSKALHQRRIDVIVAFYSAPTGQKLLKEMPGNDGGVDAAMMPLLQKQMTSMQERVQQEVAAIMKESDPGAKPATKASQN